MRPVRVLHIVSAMQRGGVETMIMNFYRNIDRDKVQFDFIVHGSTIGHFEDEIHKLGGQIYHVLPKADGFLKNMNQVYSVIKKNQYQIVHVHQDAMSMFALREAKRAGAAIRIAHAHSTSMPPSFLKKLVYSYAIRNTEKYTTHKFACSIASAKYLYGNNLDNVTYIHNGINTDEFRYHKDLRNRVRQEHKWNDKFVLGHIGNFLYPKNHSFVLKIYYELLRKNPDSILVLCGSGPMMQDVMQQADNLGIKKNVFFMGNVPNVYDLMQGMDCMILPSLYEGFPVVTIEAQCNGLPLIVSDVITKETQITDCIKYISLSEKPEIWVKEIIETKDYVRKDNSDIVKKRGYDIRDVASDLQNIYLSFIDKEERKWLPF